MPTTKQRINISVSKSTNQALSRLARHDHMPIATKATRLLELALDIEEDVLLEKLAAQRDASGGPYVSHDEAWK